MKPLNRRQFLGSVTAVAAAFTQLRSSAADTPASAPVAPTAPPAASTGRKVKLGLIGCGWYGLVDVNAAFKAGGVEVIALCDVDHDHLEKSAAEIEKRQGSRPKTFKLYAELLATPGLEAVIIGTPPHWHAVQLIAAVQRGLDVYCEKPLAYDIREGRAMVDAVAQSGRIVQIGLQRRQSPAFQTVRQFIADGNLGRVVQAEAQINFTNSVLSSTPQPPPASLDWDLWCGPAPLIPYSPQVGHKNWRQEKTTGQGHLYDWGLHLIDAARMILGEKSPKTISAAGGLFQLTGKITTPDTLTAQFEFERCPITWRHRMWGAEEHSPETNNGIFFYGEKGTVFVSETKWSFTPLGKTAERQTIELKADLGLLHMVDFLDAVRSRKPASCSVEEGHLSTTIVKLAMIAYETGARLTWDGTTEQIIGHPAAAKLLKREYRAPWQHPAKA